MIPRIIHFYFPYESCQSHIWQLLSIVYQCSGPKWAKLLMANGHSCTDRNKTSQCQHILIVHSNTAM